MTRDEYAEVNAGRRGPPHPTFTEKSGNLLGSNSILAEAESVIYGDREQTYGSPDKNLQVIAELWSTYLETQMRPITVDDVCNMMILLKVARLKNQPQHRDSQVDICGYAALMERVQTFRKGKDESLINQTTIDKLVSQIRK